MPRAISTTAIWMKIGIPRATAEWIK